MDRMTPHDISNSKPSSDSSPLQTVPRHHMTNRPNGLPQAVLFSRCQKVAIHPRLEALEYETASTIQRGMKIGRSEQLWKVTTLLSLDNIAGNHHTGQTL